MKFLSRIIVFSLLIVLFINTTAQKDSKSGHTIPVKKNTGYFYSYAWAGGMNSCQFGTVDLNMDGKKDLVVFDRVGNRIMPFVNHGTDGAIDYGYAPEYASRFPDINDWMILVDYDKDGKEDLFTYSPGYAGMKVFRNVSGTTFQFQLIISPYLTSFQGGGYTNILVTYADYPAISDLDGDGDLDILTFWGLGAFVEMHKNLSFEKYGTYDSLDYEKVSYCWGYFAESEESNVLTLDTCIGMGLHPITRDGVPVHRLMSSTIDSSFLGDGVPMHGMESLLILR